MKIDSKHGCLSDDLHRDVAPRDISGTSDPFARVLFNNHSAETSVSFRNFQFATDRINIGGRASVCAKDASKSFTSLDFGFVAINYFDAFSVWSYWKHVKHFTDRFRCLAE